MTPPGKRTCPGAPAVLKWCANGYNDFVERLFFQDAVPGQTACKKIFAGERVKRGEHRPCRLRSGLFGQRRSGHRRLRHGPSFRARSASPFASDHRDARSHHCGHGYERLFHVEFEALRQLEAHRPRADGRRGGRAARRQTAAVRSRRALQSGRGNGDRSLGTFAVAGSHVPAAQPRSSAGRRVSGRRHVGSAVGFRAARGDFFHCRQREKGRLSRVAGHVFSRTQPVHPGSPDRRRTFDAAAAALRRAAHSGGSGRLLRGSEAGGSGF